MEKVLINLYVPSIGESFDVYIPVFLTVKEIILLLAKAIENLSDGRYLSSGQEILCLKNRNMILTETHLLEDYAVRTGEKFVFI